MIVFARGDRLPLGHIAVVSRIVEKRVVMLTHANWSRQNGERGHVEQDVTLFDVSPQNDWSDVKVWYRDSDGLGGTIYPVQRFKYRTREGFLNNNASARPSAELSGRHPNDVGTLIDAYDRNKSDIR